MKINVAGAVDVFERVKAAAAEREPGKMSRRLLRLKNAVSEGSYVVDAEKVAAAVVARALMGRRGLN